MAKSKHTYAFLSREYAKLKKINPILLKALKFYADEENYNLADAPVILTDEATGGYDEDCGDIARAAIAKAEKGE